MTLSVRKNRRIASGAFRQFVGGCSAHLSGALATSLGLRRARLDPKNDTRGSS